MLKALILDCDPKGVENLLVLLTEHCADLVQVLQCCHDPDQAHTAILSTHPDLVFIDFKVGNAKCFELLERIRHLPVEIVFTTELQNLTIKTFEYSAFGYLLKPVNPKILRQTVERCNRVHDKEHHSKWLESLLGQYYSNWHSPSPLVLHLEEGFVFLKPDEIVRLEAQRGYTLFHLNKGKSIMVSKSLGEWEELLDKKQFFRVHASHLVNLDCVKKFLKKDGGYVMLSGGELIPVARRRKDDLINMLMKEPSVNSFSPNV